MVDGDKNYHQVTEDIIGPIEAKPGKLWCIGLSIAICLLLFGVYSVYREVLMVLDNGTLIILLDGDGILPTLFGGSVSVMQEH